MLGDQATKALRERERLDLREADGGLLVLSEPLLRCPTTEAPRGAEVLPMRSSGPTDWPTFAFDRACAGADHSGRATRNEEAGPSDRFLAAPTSLDCESVFSHDAVEPPDVWACARICFKTPNVGLERLAFGQSARRQGWAYVVTQSQSDLPRRALGTKQLRLEELRRQRARHERDCSGVRHLSAAL